MLIELDELCGSPFWDLNRTWFTENPDFTDCFKNTALVWIPCIYLWIFFPLECYFLKKSNCREIPWNKYNVTKLVLIFLMITQTLIETINNNDNLHPSIYIHTSLFKFITLILFFFLTLANIKMGVRSSGLLFGYSMILMVCGMPELQKIAQNQEQFRKTTVDLDLISTVIRWFLPVAILVLNVFADSKPKYYKCREDENICPAFEASFLSKLYLHWFNDYVWKNKKKPIENILWHLRPEEKTSNLSSTFERYLSACNDQNKSTKNNIQDLELTEFIEEKFKQTNTSHFSVLKPLLKMCWFDCSQCMLWKFMEMFSVLAYPMIFSLFLTFMESNAPSWKGYLCSFLFLFNGFFQAVLLNKMYINVIAIQTKIRSILMSVVYKKALKLSNGVRKEYTTGDIVNLISLDTERISAALKCLNNSWTSPIQVALSCYFIWNILGPSVLMSFVVVIIMLPIINQLIKKMKQLQIIEMKNKDKRGKFMQEILAGIKVLKMYAWESHFEKELCNLRNKELKIIRKHAYLNAVILFTFACVPFLMSAATFSTYLISSIYHTLDVKKAFVTISFFNALRNPLQSLPDAISFTTQAIVSIKRINKFLNLQELNLNTVSHQNTDEAIIIENGSFSWTENAASPTLKNLNIKIKESSLVAVIGSVGAGKSSLISALLSEMVKFEGHVNVKGKIAYVSQHAWILNASIKENITLGLQVDPLLYDKALEITALKTDLIAMPDYDQTEIGEKGINLSGGQKQRISLARAICYNVDVYLLDDPLSAVDSNTANHIFQNALGRHSELKNKTRLLITHATSFLPQTDFIIMLEKGSVVEKGTFGELSRTSKYFNEFLRVNSNEMQEDNKDGDIKRNKEKMVNESIGLIRKKNSAEKSCRDSNQQLEGRATKKLIEREQMETGTIKGNVYTFYLASIGPFFVFISFTMYAMYQLLSICSNIWLLKWSRDENSSATETSSSSIDKYFYFEIYLVLGIAEALAILMGNLILFSGLLKASSFFHNTLLASILKWPSWLLDSIPIGRIISRLTADIHNLDSRIGLKLANVIIFLSRLISICFVIIYTTPICVGVLIPIFITMYLVLKFYSGLAHQISRIQASQQSPLYSCLVENISDVASVRAYKYENQSILKAMDKMDRFSSSFMSYFFCCRCMATKMDILGGCIGFFASFFVVSGRKDLDLGLIGFSMSYSIQMTRELTWLLLRVLETEDGIVAVERIKEYIEKPQEAPSHLPIDAKLKEWPSKGEIIFQNYNLRYRQDSNLVLNDISFQIKSQEKVGIVGRTGAGKTSLILGLFRLIEPAAGKILIDDVDISTVGLHLLRSHLTIIPQDPVLFLGSLRFNLDPIGNNDDDSLWKILEKAHLKQFVRNLPGGLHFTIGEGGGNLSYGQKQLICLARALLRKTKILILDEATASVDVETDELVQKTIQTEFADCTVLTIAHRLNTVREYDRILVIDGGTIAEFDTPITLLNSQTSIFYRMARESGLI